MNTTEKVVESYFRLCRGCFTMADLKVVKGNNRQIDLLAVHLKTGAQFHVEVSVTHQENWCPTPDELFEAFEQKYFGVPEKKREGPKTDFALGKRYEKQIFATYESVGLDPKRLRRIWVCWTVVGAEDLQAQVAKYCERRGLPRDGIEILSFRDAVIPELQKAVGTANYDDDVLRMLSLLQQFEKQQGRAKSRM